MKWSAWRRPIALLRAAWVPSLDARLTIHS
jgi:hypothetical protein